ncbi:DUF3108 domain-containing protein [Haloflavibacter putidus]|uniref:DUF3108 domain-containing protein n=1 Tax=Haloflavibacter putidus TaxID=2576776 RepID=A0A507ZJQ1_9FLAO|nr:DUF3108 domain-containing protein [Haloflavibacter putidus]TQD36911.1 DUF3108 domain-containing protein [Haloflavibacter putidus]
MKKLLFAFFSVLFSVGSISAQSSAYQPGEWFKFRIHYGWFNASYATLAVHEETLFDMPVYHIKGRGKSTGLLDLFFKVDDRYESYVRQDNQLPLRFIRDINEGGHTKDRIINFDQVNNRALVHDKKRNTRNRFDTKPKVQDMISVFYFLRNEIDEKTIEKNDAVVVDMFFDDENYKFKTVFLGRETIKTKFGKIKALKFRPYVQAGRIFEEEESLTFWVSDDANKIPLKIRADLAVGSLEADLDAFRGLKHSFQFKK